MQTIEKNSRITKHKRCEVDKKYLQTIINKESRYGCLYILRKYVLEYMPAEELRLLLKPRFGRLLNLETVNAVQLVSYIDDFILPEMSLNSIREWILKDIKDEELLQSKEISNGKKSKKS